MIYSNLTERKYLEIKSSFETEIAIQNKLYSSARADLVAKTCKVALAAVCLLASAALMLSSVVALVLNPLVVLLTLPIPAAISVLGAYCWGRAHEFFDLASQERRLSALNLQEQTQELDELKQELKDLNREWDMQPQNPRFQPSHEKQGDPTNEFIPIDEAVPMTGSD